MSEDKFSLIGLQKFDGLEISLVNSNDAIIEFEVKGGEEELRKANAQILFGVTSAEFQGRQIKLKGLSATSCNDPTIMRFVATYNPS